MFYLPSLIIEPGSYALVRGRGSDDWVNGAQVVYVRSSDIIPYWDANGFAELIRDSATADFVRFGLDATSPTTGGWNGGDATALPNSAADYGKSIARNGANDDNDNFSDWTPRAFATPGGPNDVAFDADADGDGIPDSSEVSGSTFAGLPLYDWGARAGQTNIFIHIDYMNSADPGVKPRKEALDKVVAAFAAHKIYVIFDVGNLYVSGTDPNNYNLDNKSHKVPFSTAIAIGQAAGCANLYSYKVNYMALAKKQIFHYLLFAYSQNASGSGGSSGIAEMPGNDFIVTLGNWGLAATPATELNRLINYQAATIMHELGHNLGLHHGGDEDLNYKPNYYSIMNYEYQLEGLSPLSTTHEGDRYYFYRYGTVDKWLSSSPFKYYFLTSGNEEADLTNGPLTNPSACKIDYSDGSGSSINENLFNESIGLGRPTSQYVDYNGSSNQTANISMILNPTETGSLLTLKDYNDWGKLDLFFIRNKDGDSAGARSPSALKIRPDVIGDDRQPYIIETLKNPRQR
jgi:hypothetical protein